MSSDRYPRNRTCLCSLCLWTAWRRAGSFEISSPMIRSVTSSNPFVPQIRERLDQPDEVLVRLDVARVEHETAIELIPLANSRDRFLRRRHTEAFVNGVVDDDDLVCRDIEEADDVALGCF